MWGTGDMLEALLYVQKENPRCFLSEMENKDLYGMLLRLEGTLRKRPAVTTYAYRGMRLRSHSEIVLAYMGFVTIDTNLTTLRFLDPMRALERHMLSVVRPKIKLEDYKHMVEVTFQP